VRQDADVWRGSVGSRPTLSAVPASFFGRRMPTASCLLRQTPKHLSYEGLPHQMTSTSLKFNAVVRGLILGVIIALGASVSGLLCDTHF
jgi:hypothetical protein